MEIPIMKSVKTEEKEAMDEFCHDQIIHLPIEICSLFFWSALHRSMKNYSYTKKQAATGRFPFMREIYSTLFDGNEVVMERKDIDGRIPEHLRVHILSSGSTCIWVTLKWKYDVTKQLLSASVHYEIKCGADGVVKWFVAFSFWLFLLLICC
jgi:hypothetical protein